MKDKFAAIRKYNFWDHTHDTGFLRQAYTGKIFDYANSQLVKVLAGQRRAGKSYILRQIIVRLIENGVNARNTLYINKEFTDFDFLKDYKDLENMLKLYCKAMRPQGKVWLFIDEIQNIDGWERFVNSCSQNFTENYKVFISGSNAKMLSGELATLLSGRYVSFEILPFSFAEYCGITQKEVSKQSYISYLQGGALPELFALPNEETRRNYVSAIKDTVLLRDIIQRHSIKDPKLLEDVFVYLVNNAASLVSIANIVNFFKSVGRKTTYDTILAYIGYMEDAYLVHKSERYDIRGKGTIAGVCKYYINDLSFKNLLYSGFGYGMGYQLENLVYLTLRREGFKVYTGALRNGEVDFVATKNDRKLYVQAAYLLADEATVQREYSPLETIGDNYEKIVVSLDDARFPNRNGIRHMQAWQWEI